jgi:hypothetical protein
MNPGFGRDVISKSQQNRDCRKGKGWQTDKSWVVRGLHINDACNNLQEEHNELQAIDMDIVGMARAQADSGLDTSVPTAIEPKTKRVIDSSTAA